MAPPDPIADRWYGGVGQGAQGELVCGGVVEVTAGAPGRFSGRITHAGPGVCANPPPDAEWQITKTASGVYEGTVRWYTNQGVLGVGRARWENTTSKYMNVIASPPPNAPARTPELRMVWERLDPGEVPPYHVPR